MGAAAKTSASRKGGRGRKPTINTNKKSASSATSATSAAAAASKKNGKGTKAAQLESKLAKLAGAGQQHQPEEEGRVEVPVAMAMSALIDESDAASSSSEGDDAPPAVDPITSADFVALSSAVQGKLAGGTVGHQAQQAQNKASKGEKGDPVKAAARQGRILYLGHVPHGFFEEQMRGFFAQFGEVTRLRLSRSKKTAKSRGYAFIEFADKEVARIVAETMDGYYLSGRKLVCHALEPAKAHPGLFDDADKTWRVIPWRRLERERRDAPKTEQDARKCLSRLLRGDGKRRQKLAKLGIDYAFAGYAAEAHLAAVKRKRDDPEAGKDFKQEEAQLPASAASKKRGRKEQEGEEAAEQKTAVSNAKAGAKGGSSAASKKVKKDCGEASEQRKAPPAVAATAATKKRARAGSEEVEGKKRAPVMKTAATVAGRKKGARGR